MKRIAIVYFSKSGATQAVAEQISSGVNEEVNCHSELIRIQPQDIQQGRYQNTAIWSILNDSDAIIFGSPTYMGSPAAQFKAFMDASSEEYGRKAWHDKMAAGFTTGGSINGEQQQTLLSFFILANQHGMIWAGLDISEHTDELGLNRTGSSIGLVASAGEKDQLIHPNDLQTAYYFGQRIARLIDK